MSPNTFNNNHISLTRLLFSPHSQNKPHSHSLHFHLSLPSLPRVTLRIHPLPRPHGLPPLLPRKNGLSRTSLSLTNRIPQVPRSGAARLPEPVSVAGESRRSVVRQCSSPRTHSGEGRAELDPLRRR